jgi:hypothetical protein
MQYLINMINKFRFAFVFVLKTGNPKGTAR